MLVWITQEHGRSPCLLLKATGLGRDRLNKVPGLCWYRGTDERKLIHQEVSLSERQAKQARGTGEVLAP